MSAVPEQYEGFTISSTKEWSNFSRTKLTPKNFEDHDVDIENECCGVCGSDVHTITGGWGELGTTPLCVGHEIIGKVLRVGKAVKQFQPGDRVGVGAQIQSCMQCNNCKTNNENYCTKSVDTYNSPYMEDEGRSDKPMKDSKGNQIFSQGGYSSHTRAHQQFVFAIPKNIPSHEAAPMMCAGLTTYSPLKRANIGPGKTVGILGIGGLGHFGIMWAKAMGAEVYALSHTPSKKSEATDLGADKFICTEDENWADDLAFKFDFILNTADMTHKFDLTKYAGTLKVQGEFHNVGMPDEALPGIMAQSFITNGFKLTGSKIGSKKEMLEMLDLASKKGIHPMVETIDISEKGCKEAVERVKVNDVRYRLTLVRLREVFGTGK